MSFFLKSATIKTFKWIAYVSAGIGTILLLTGVISALTFKHKLEAIYIACYFLAANSFLLITTVILLFIHLQHHNKK
jgi:hypothetical protein